MSGCGEGAEWVEQLRAPRQGHCTSQSQPVKATLLRRAVTLCATVARWLRRQNGLIWYYLVHDNYFVSGLDWGTIISCTRSCAGYVPVLPCIQLSSCMREIDPLTYFPVGRVVLVYAFPMFSKKFFNFWSSLTLR